ncbi:BRISC and BRCA1-A complex member 1 isoform X6 [Agelaius phoeniceus]|uniref:BRISC and BRCA1-A complex member 1 isoform X6 n=1 Tax=Agelaius phoeniceus TaxID=39638 RepID=UPI00405521C1
MVAAGHPKGLQLPAALPRRHFRRSPSGGERGPRHREPPGLGSQPHSTPKPADFGVPAAAHPPVLGCQPRSFGMDTSEPGSAAEDEEEKVPEVRPRTRSNPEGAEDRAPSGPGSVGSRGEAPGNRGEAPGNRGEAPGNRSEGEGEAASAGHSPPGQPGTAWHGPGSHGQHGEVTVRTPRVNCPEKVIICLDLAEEMAVPKLESFNGCRSNALTVAQKMIEMFVRTKHKIDKSHEFALVVVNNDATWPAEGGAAGDRQCPDHPPALRGQNHPGVWAPALPAPLLWGRARQAAAVPLFLLRRRLHPQRGG